MAPARTILNETVSTSQHSQQPHPSSLPISEGMNLAREHHQAEESHMIDNSKLLRAVRMGNLTEFANLLYPEVPTGISTEPEVIERSTSGNNSLSEVPPTGNANATSGQLPLLLGVTSSGDGVLHIAVRHGHEDMVRAIFRVLLCQCVGSSSQDSVTWCSQEFAKFLRARNRMGETCLHEAVRWGHINIVKLLMEVDACYVNDAMSPVPVLVQIVDNDGSSPLYLATTLRRLDIVKVLTVGDYAYSVSHAGPAGKTALHAAVLLSTDLCSSLLIWKKSLAKSTDALGRTPLHYMATCDTAVTELILHCDASSGYCADSKGCLPIHAAASKGRLDIIIKLLEKCPDCDSSSNNLGQTFLHVAVQNGHKRIVHYTCNNPRFSAILNMRDQNGDTALHLAVQSGNGFIFRCLLGNKGVYLSFINKQGCTPLDIVVLRMKKNLRFKQRSREWILNDLLAAGADFCACRWDYFSSKSGIKSKQEQEESERISKSAGLFAAGALLIFTISYQAPFDVSDKKIQTMNSVTNGSLVDNVAGPRELIFASLVEADAVSLTAAVVAIFFCTFAGFPTASNGARFLALVAGGASLFAASLVVIVVFVLGLSMVYPGMWALYVVYILFVIVTIFTISAILKMSPPTQVLAHAHVRRIRLGYGQWIRSSFRWHPGASWVPLMHVIFFLLNCVGLGFGTYFLLLLLVTNGAHHIQYVHCGVNSNCTVKIK